MDSESPFPLKREAARLQTMRSVTNIHPPIRIHQPDINGTHAEINQPPSESTKQMFLKWTSRGNVFGPNTSHTIHKASINLKGLVNGYWIVELGTLVYAPDATTPVMAFSLDTDEKQAIADACVKLGLVYQQTVAFLPQPSIASKEVGEIIYINPSADEQAVQNLVARHEQIAAIVRDPQTFSYLLTRSSTHVGMVEFRPLDGDVKNLPVDFQGLQTTYDSGGTVYITPKGINKATTFREVLDRMYHAEPNAYVSIAGDSMATDGPLFLIPHIRKIAVSDPSLNDLSPRGPTHYARNPEEARQILEQLISVT